MGLISGTGTAVGVARPGQRQRGTLVATYAQGIDYDGDPPTAGWIWANGVVLTGDTCGDLSGTSITCTGDNLPAAEAWGDTIAFDPFKLDVGRSCGVLSGRRDAELTAAARRRIDEWISARLARELYLGTITGNPAITVSPTVLTVAAALPAWQAFELLEQEIASRVGNMAVTFHVTPAMLVEAVRQDLVEPMAEDGSVFYTATGHVVIGDAGYDGSIPTGSPVDENGAPVAPGALGAGEEYIYVTGAIAWDYGPELVSDVEDIGPLSARQNRRRSLVQRPAIAVFDPTCIHLAVLATLSC